MPNLKFNPMTLRIITILLILCILPNCKNPSTTNQKEAYYLKHLSKIYSSDSTKYISIVENGDNQQEAITQAYVGFILRTGEGGCGIFAAKGTNLPIDIFWLHHNDLMIRYPTGLEIIKQDTSASFKKETVNIFYQEKLIPDSLSGKILKYSIVGMMDTITAIIKGTVIDLESSQPVSNANVSLISGLVLFPNSTNEDGVYQFNHINAGNYRFHLSSAEYNDFEIDTIKLKNGEIKEFNIGLIKK